jgi:hypothetical protein
MTRNKDLTPNDKRIIAVMFLVLIIALLTSCTPSPEQSYRGTIGGANGYKIHEFELDGCWYVAVDNHGLVHKANCPNPTHKR